MNRNLNREYFVETMAHIMTIENILMARYNISSEEINKKKILIGKRLKNNWRKSKMKYKK